MKKFVLPVLFMALAMFTSCEEENINHNFIIGNWVISDEGSPATTLVFDEKNMTVKRGTAERPPFGAGELTWDYVVTRDSVLKITRYVYYGDDTDVISCDLHVEMRGNNTLCLIYRLPDKESYRRYKFVRR